MRGGVIWNDNDDIIDNDIIHNDNDIVDPSGRSDNISNNIDNNDDCKNDNNDRGCGGRRFD